MVLRQPGPGIIPGTVTIFSTHQGKVRTHPHTPSLRFPEPDFAIREDPRCSWFLTDLLYFHGWPTGTLEYLVNIVTPGVYTFHVHNYHGAGPECSGLAFTVPGCECNDGSECNDIWVTMDDLPWDKAFSNTVGLWIWNTAFHHENQTPEFGSITFSLTAGMHTLKISGRSHGMTIDRILLHNYNSVALAIMAGEDPTTVPPGVTTVGSSVMQYYNFLTGGCCRVADGGTGTLTQVASVTDTQTCAGLCLASDVCVGFEISNHEGCELHEEAITHTAGFGACECYQKLPDAPVVTPSPPPVFVGTPESYVLAGPACCRVAGGGTGTFTLDTTAMDLPSCQAACSAQDDCVGIELSGEGCEMHTVAITGTGGSEVSCQCFIRNTASPTPAPPTAEPTPTFNILSCMQTNCATILTSCTGACLSELSAVVASGFVITDTEVTGPNAEFFLSLSQCSVDNCFVTPLHTFPPTTAAPTPPAPPPATTAGCLYVHGLDLLDDGSSAPIVTTNSDECGVLCLASPVCSHYSFFFGTCFMKASGSQPVISANDGGSAMCLQVGEVPADFFDAANGPDGAMCEHGIVVDAVPLDSTFTCDCSNTGYTGPNCDVVDDAPVTHTCTLLPGTNLIGDDLIGKGHIPKPSAAACAALCDVDVECKAFTYIWDHCYLKSDATLSEAQPSGVSGICDPSIVPPTTTAAPIDMAVCSATNCGSIMLTCTGDCGTALSLVAGANFAITEADVSGAHAAFFLTLSQCLVDNCGVTALHTFPPTTASPTGAPVAPAGPPPPPVTSAGCIYISNVDLPTSGIAPPVAVENSDACGTMCLASASCSHFSYFWGQCFMKGSAPGAVAVAHNGGSAVCLDIGGVPDDIFDPANGPDGASCEHGTLVDVVPFDSTFTCDCTGTGFSGPNCDVIDVGPVVHTCILSPGVNYVGNDIVGKSHISVGNADACAALCEAEAACFAFTYVWQHCYLKSAGTVSSAEATAVSGTCDPSITAPPTPFVVPEFKLCVADDPGFDYDGQDTNGVGTHLPAEAASDCAALCEADADCLFFSWLNNHCYLKLSNVGRKTSGTAVSGSCQICLGAPCTESPTVATTTAAPTPLSFKSCSASEPNVDFDGSDVGGAGTHVPLVDAAACALLCQDFATCQFFTYVGGHCYLKTADTGRKVGVGAVSGNCQTCIGAPCETTQSPTAVPTLPTFKTCTSNDPGADYVGNDLGGASTHIPMADADACAAFCETKVDCQVFTFSFGHCYLKLSNDGRVESATAMSGTCVTCVGAPCQLTEAPTAEPTLPTFKSCSVDDIGGDYFGSDVGGASTHVPMSNAAACATFCETEPACQFFTYTFEHCYLKLSNAGRIESAVAVSGSCKTCVGAPCTESPTTASPTGAPTVPTFKTCTVNDPSADYFGDDLAGGSNLAAADAAACALLCESTEGCTFFTYVTSLCYLKTSNSGRFISAGAMSGSCETCLGAPCTNSPTSQPTLPTVKECVVDDVNHEYFGQDTNGVGTHIPLATAMECASVCESNPACQFFTYTNDHCYLKTGTEGRIFNTAAVSGSCRTCLGACVTTEAPQTTSTETRACVQSSPGVNIVGNGVVDAQNLPASDPSVCESLCLAHPDCSFYSFLYGLCSLKTSDAGKYTSTDGVSGECGPASEIQDSSSGQIESGKVCALNDAGFDYNGEDLGGSATHIPGTTPEGCAALCENHPSCNAFTFVFNHCYLKASASGRVASGVAVSGQCQVIGSTEAPPPGLCVQLECTAEVALCNADADCAKELADANLEVSSEMLAGSNAALLQPIASCAVLECGHNQVTASPTTATPTAAPPPGDVAACLQSSCSTELLACTSVASCMTELVAETDFAITPAMLNGPNADVLHALGVCAHTFCGQPEVTLPPTVGATSAPTATPLPIDLFSELELAGAGGCCRTGDNGQGTFDVNNAASTIESCATLCAGNDNCLGFEVNIFVGCELHTVAVTHVAPSGNCQCFSRTVAAPPAPPTLPPTPAVVSVCNDATDFTPLSSSGLLTPVATCAAAWAQAHGLLLSMSADCSVVVPGFGSQTFGEVFSSLAAACCGSGAANVDACPQPTTTSAPTAPVETVDAVVPFGNGCCRTATNGFGSFTEQITASFELCGASCLTTPGCVAIEWSPGNGKCEIHSELITATTNQPSVCQCGILTAVPVVDTAAPTTAAPTTAQPTTATPTTSAPTTAAPVADLLAADVGGGAPISLVECISNHCTPEVIACVPVGCFDLLINAQTAGVWEFSEADLSNPTYGAQLNAVDACAANHCGV